MAALLAPVQAEAASLFNNSIAGSSNFSLFPFWQRVLVDMPVQVDAANQAHGPRSTSAATLTPAVVAAGSTPNCGDERHCIPPEWLFFLAAQTALTRRAQLEAVNKWANAKPYVEDWVNWHVADYWETPGEFIARGGDCEDFAIAKYFSLIRLGFPAEDLRIVVMADSTAHGFHAVLAARLDGTVWLLDNSLSDVVAMDSQPQYSAVYSLNQQDWWMHSNPTVQLTDVTIVAAPIAVDRLRMARN